MCTWGRKQASCGTSDQNIRSPIRPEGLAKNLNDSVWQLHSPLEGKPDVDIIFFHGLQMGDHKEAFWNTWLAKNETQLVWPKDWLSKSLPKARILSVSYNSSADKVKGNATQGDIDSLATNLIRDIVLARRHEIGQKCPVFLVGHCLGGIVMKEFIIRVINEQQFFTPSDNQSENEQGDLDRVKRFLENFKGAFFYGTPNGGMPDKVTPFADRNPTNNSPILSLLKILDTERGRINQAFMLLRRNRRIPTFGIAENLWTNNEGFHGLVVPEGSARYDVDGYYTHQEADHFTVCQARSITDSTVIEKLIDFIIAAAPAIELLENPAAAELEAQNLR